MSRTRVRIRRVDREQAADMATIHRRVCADAWDEAAMASLVEHPGTRALIAERGREAIGFLMGRIAADEAEILTLAVLPGERRRGVADALVRSLINLLREEGAARVYLEVGAWNEAATALYRRLGFVEVGRRAAYYQRGRAGAEDAVVMAATLKRDPLK